MFKNLSLVMKYLPIILELAKIGQSVVEQVESKIKALKQREKAVEAGQQTSVEDRLIAIADKTITSHRERVITIIHSQFLSDNLKQAATLQELQAFGQASQAFAEGLVNLVVAVRNLIKP